MLRELPDLADLGDVPRRSTKRWAKPALAAAAVAVIVIAAAILLPGGSGESRGFSDNPSTSRPSAPHAPPGTRLVGMGRLAVAVPESWSTNHERCGTPLSNTVIFDADGVLACGITPRPHVSALHIVPATSPLALPWIYQHLTASEVGGITIERTPINTGDEGFSIGALVARSAGVVMYMTSPDPAVVDSMLDSVMVLPAGWVTIPFNPNLPFLPNERLALERAGLIVEIIRRDLPGRSSGSLLGVTPALGSVVPVGSTVHVVVDSGN